MPQGSLNCPISVAPCFLLFFLRWIALTQMKARHARRVFPCFDDPAYRAVFDIEILRRKDSNSIANMPILKIEMR